MVKTHLRLVPRLRSRCRRQAARLPYQRVTTAEKKAHDGTIIPEAINQIWGTNATMYAAVREAAERDVNERLEPTLNPDDDRDEMPELQHLTAASPISSCRRIKNPKAHAAASGDVIRESGSR